MSLPEEEGCPSWLIPYYYTKYDREVITGSTVMRCNEYIHSEYWTDPKNTEDVPNVNTHNFIQNIDSGELQLVCTDCLVILRSRYIKNLKPSQWSHGFYYMHYDSTIIDGEILHRAKSRIEIPLELDCARVKSFIQMRRALE